MRLGETVCVRSPLNISIVSWWWYCINSDRNKVQTVCSHFLFHGICCHSLGPVRVRGKERSGKGEGEGQTVQETRDQTGKHKGKCHGTKRVWRCHTRITSFSMGLFDVYQKQTGNTQTNTYSHTPDTERRGAGQKRNRPWENHEYETDRRCNLKEEMNDREWLSFDLAFPKNDGH